MLLSDDFFLFLFIFISQSKNKNVQLKNLYREISNDPLIQLNETNKFIEAIENKINKEKEEERKLVFEVQKKMNSGEIISINDNLCNNYNIDTINNDRYIITSTNNLIVKKGNVSKILENIKKKEIINNNITINNNDNNENNKNNDNNNNDNNNNDNSNCNNNNNINIQKQNNNFNEIKGKDNYDLEQWVNYIENDDKNKTNKKKKHKKSKNKNKNNENNSLNKENELFEKEIELIKISLLNNSCNKYSIRKLKPKLSENWLIKYNNNNI